MLWARVWLSVLDLALDEQEGEKVRRKGRELKQVKTVIREYVRQVFLLPLPGLVLLHLLIRPVCIQIGFLIQRDNNRQATHGASPSS